jgi:hypothetical protein
MKNLAVRRIVLVATLVLANSVITGCGSKVEGTYTDGAQTMLELRSGGKAAFTFLGSGYPCTYKVDGNKVMLDCAAHASEGSMPWPRALFPQKLNLTIHDDGSLTSGDLLATLKKTA